MDLLELSIPPRAEAVPTARNELRRWLVGGIADRLRIYDVLVLVSELVTNGVIHDGGDDIVVRVWPSQGGLSIEVVTADSPPSRERHARPTVDPSETGRGLTIVASLADRLSVDEHDGRRYVSCHITLGT